MSKVTIVVVFVVFALIGNLLLADEKVPDLITDRPDFTESAASVPKGSWQFEFGYTFSKDKYVKDHTIGELLVRVSVLENFELRLGVNSFRSLKVGNLTFDGLEDMELGFKYALVPEKVAVIVSTTLPTGAKAFRTSRMQPGVVLSLAHDINETFSIGSNLGLAAVYDGVNTYPEYSASFVVGVSLTETLGTYLEYFGIYYKEKDDESTHHVDAGFTYLVNPTFQLDIRGGRILNKGRSDYFLGVGAVKRF